MRSGEFVEDANKRTIREHVVRNAFDNKDLLVYSAAII